MDVLHPSAQHGGHVSLVRCRHNFPHRLSEHQQGVHVLVQKGVDAPLSPSHVHLLQEALQFPVRPRVLALCGDAAAEADDFTDAGVHQGHSLPNGPIELLVAGPQGSVPPPQAEGRRVAPYDLRRSRRPGLR